MEFPHEENAQLIDTRSEEAKRDEAMQETVVDPPQLQPGQPEAPVQALPTPSLDATVGGAGAAVVAAPAAKKPRAKKQPLPPKVAPPPLEIPKLIPLEPAPASEPLPKQEEVPAARVEPRREAEDEKEEEKKAPAAIDRVSGIDKTANLIRKPLSSIVSERYYPPQHTRLPAVTPETVAKASKWTRRFTSV